MAKGSWWLGMTENSGSAFWGFWTGAGSAIFTPIAVILGNTYHVVGTYDGVISRLYVNGIQVASQTIGGGSIGGPLRIGTWDAAQYWFSGVIDEVAVYDRVLSDSEILAHYNTGMNTP